MNSAEAEACFGDGNFVEAARLLGKVTAAVPAFEEVVLRFVEVNSPQALQAFLQTKMDSLGHEDKAQVTFHAQHIVIDTYQALVVAISASQTHTELIIGKYTTCTAGAAAGHDEVVNDTRITLPMKPMFPLLWK